MTDNAKSSILSKSVSSSIGLEPPLRFPGFEGEYNYTPLATYLHENKERNRDLKYNKDDVLSVSGEYGIVNQIELQGRSFAGESVKDYHVVESNNIVYTKSPLKANPYGIIKVNKGVPGIVSTLYAVYHVNNNAVPKYVDYYFANDLKLNKYLKPLVNIGAKHDMKVNNDSVLTGIVAFPEKIEQQKVADFLSIVDERIEKQRQLVEVLKRYKRGLFYSIYSAKQLKWESVCIGDFSKVYGGYAFDSKTYSESGKYRVLTIGSVSGNRYADIDSCNMVDEIPSDIQHYQILRPNDLVISMTGNVGRVSIVNQLDCLLNQRVAKLDITDSTIREYVYQVLSCSNFEQEMNNVGQGAAQKNIKNTDIEHFDFYIPNNETELLTVVGLLWGIDNTILKQEQILTELANSKQALLQQMFI